MAPTTDVPSILIGMEFAKPNTHPEDQDSGLVSLVTQMYSLFCCHLERVLLTFPR